MMGRRGRARWVQWKEGPRPRSLRAIGATKKGGREMFSWDVSGVRLSHLPGLVGQTGKKASACLFQSVEDLGSALAALSGTSPLCGFVSVIRACSNFVIQAI